MLVNLCYVSRGMGARKVSNSKSDLQGQSMGIGNGAIRFGAGVMIAGIEPTLPPFGVPFGVIPLKFRRDSLR